MEKSLARPGMAPHTQGLKVLYKSSSCCPCSVSVGQKEGKGGEGRSPRVTVLALQQGTLTEAAPAAEGPS